MNPSKLSDFAGLPRPTLYRKLERLRREGVLAPGDSEIRVQPEFLASGRLAKGIDRAAAAVRDCAGNMRPPARAEGPRPARGLSKGGVIAALALDLARLSHVGQGPWFAAEARLWLVRWCIARSHAAGQDITPGDIADLAGVSRTAVYRHLGELTAGGHLRRTVNGRLAAVGLNDPASEQARIVGRMSTSVRRAFHTLSELDGAASGP